MLPVPRSTPNPKPLSAKCGLQFDARACLPLRFPDVSCGRCEDECPTDALSVGSNSLVASDDCVDCGRCTAVCPTGALTLPGFAVVDVALGTKGRVFVDCWRVPPADSPDGAVRVPCLAALKPSQLLRLANTEGAVFLDRGWCAECTAGGEPQPWAKRMVEANDWLTSLDHPTDRRLSVRTAPLPARYMQDPKGTFNLHRPVPRRDFLRHLAGEATAALRPEADLPRPEDPQSRVDGRARIHPLERIALLIELSRSARHSGGRLPPSLFPAVVIGQACRNHAVCARSCPTAALTVYEDDTTAGIGFDSTLCIACGTCVTACPEGALTFHPAGTGAPRRASHRLTSHEQRVCFDCGRAYAEPARNTPGPDETPICPTCRKSQELSRSLFSGLFAARPP